MGVCITYEHLTILLEVIISSDSVTEERYFYSEIAYGLLLGCMFLLVGLASFF